MFLNKEKNKIKINTVYPTIISLTTIPSRIKYTVKVVQSMLNGLSGFEKLIVNLPCKRKDFDFIKDSRLVINKMNQDYGPITKIWGTIQLFPYPREMNLLILDDNEYHLDGIKIIAERQDKDHNKTFSYYKYNYKGIEVPQGVDIISFWYPNLRNFQTYVKQYLSNKYCKRVDDLLIGKYLMEHGIKVEELPRHWKWVWKVNNHDDGGLFKVKGEYSRSNSMKNCFHLF